MMILIRRNNMFCPICGNEEKFYIKEENENIVVKGEPIETNSKITYCEKCNNKVWNPELEDANLKKAYDIYKAKNHLLTSSQIKEIRNQYNISQSTFSKILGVGEKTITRYENGTIQDAALNNLILLAGNANNFEKLFKNAKSKLSEEEFCQIDKLIQSKKVKVFSKDGYKTVNWNCMYGGFTYEESKKSEYKFDNAI